MTQDERVTTPRRRFVKVEIPEDKFCWACGKPLVKKTSTSSFDRKTGEPIYETRAVCVNKLCGYGRLDEILITAVMVILFLLLGGFCLAVWFA